MAGKRKMQDVRRKGHDFERAIARDIREIYPNTKRNSQAASFSEEDNVALCDVTDVTPNGMPFDIECKAGKKIPFTPAMKQAEDQCRADRAPAVVFEVTGKNQHQPSKRWAIIPYDCFLDLVAHYRSINGQPTVRQQS